MRQSKILQAFTNRRIAVTFLLGFASSLPLPLVMGTLDAWMASVHVNLKTIGLFSLVQLPYSFKVLWAPLLDRYTPPFLHRRAAWMLLTQVLLMFFIVIMGICDPVQAPWVLAGLAVTVAFLSATQDISIDAYRAELLPEREMGAGASVAVVGLRLALLTSGAVALILSDHMPWSAVYAIMAGLMVIGMLTAFFSPAPSFQGKPPKTMKEAVVEPFRTFVKRPAAYQILFFLLLFKVGDVMAGKMTTPFLIHLGFSRTEIGTVNKGFGMIVTIVGSLFGGATVARLGIVSSLWLFGILQPISNISLVVLALVGKSHAMMFTAIGLENVCSGMGTAALLAFLMSVCDKSFTATQYALLSSIFALTRTLMGPVAGYLADKLPWPTFFSVCVVSAIPGLCLLWNIKRVVSRPAAASAPG